MANERGFTLLEVLVAFVIAAAAIAVLMRANLTGLETSRTAARYQEAVARARSHLDALGRGQPINAGTLSGDDGGGFAWRIDVVPAAVGRTPALGDGAIDAALTLFDVAVWVGWSDGGRPREVVLRTRRAGPPSPVR
jgi:general secretion pathway protein I